MTNTRTIEGIRLIARNTQKMKVFDKAAYSFSHSAVMKLLNEAETYQERYIVEFTIYEKACIDFGKIDTNALRKKAKEISEQNDEYENDLYRKYLDESIEKVNPPYSKIMEWILDEVGYYHKIQLYDGKEWFDEDEIDSINYDDDEKGTFTLKKME